MLPPAIRNNPSSSIPSSSKTHVQSSNGYAILLLVILRCSSNGNPKTGFI